MYLFEVQHLFYVFFCAIPFEITYYVRSSFSEGTTPLGRTSPRRRRAALNTHTRSRTIRQETHSLLYVFLALNNLARVEQERSYSLLNSF